MNDLARPIRCIRAPGGVTAAGCVSLPPFYEVRDEAWAKEALLYWDSIATIVHWMWTSRALPQSRVSAVPGDCGLRASASRAHCRRVRTVAVRPLRGPGPEPQQVSAEPDTAAAAGSAAGC
jgi:hypothetical protein